MNEKTDYSDKIFVKPVYPKEIFKNADRNYYKAYYDFYDYKFDKACNDLSKYGNSDYGYEDIPVNETETINALKAIKKIALFPEIQKLRVQFELPFPSPPKELKDI